MNLRKDHYRAALGRVGDARLASEGRGEPSRRGRRGRGRRRAARPPASAPPPTAPRDPEERARGRGEAREGGSPPRRGRTAPRGPLRPVGRAPSPRAPLPRAGRAGYRSGPRRPSRGGGGARKVWKPRAGRPLRGGKPGRAPGRSWPRGRGRKAGHPRPDSEKGKPGVPLATADTRETKQRARLLAVDHSARASMKNAASCEN